MSHSTRPSPSVALGSNWARIKEARFRQRSTDNITSSYSPSCGSNCPPSAACQAQKCVSYAVLAIKLQALTHCVTNGTWLACGVYVVAPSVSDRVRKDVKKGVESSAP
eukprot:6460560-Amphidinium_carterae.2